MSKEMFTAKEIEVLQAIMGKERKGLTTFQQESIVRDLAATFGLTPMMLVLGDAVVPYAWDTYRKYVTSTRDGFCMAYYHPRDCAALTGTSADNWGQWARLQFGKNNVFSPLVTLPVDMYDILRDKGYAKPDGPRRPHRFLSVTMVAFYIAAQTDAWDSPLQIDVMTRMKRVIARQGIPVIDVVVKDSGIEKVLSEVKAPIQGAQPAPVGLEDAANKAIDILMGEAQRETEIKAQLMKTLREFDHLAADGIITLTVEEPVEVLPVAPESAVDDILGDVDLSCAIPLEEPIQEAPAEEPIQDGSLPVDMSSLSKDQLTALLQAAEREMRQRQEKELEAYCSKAIIIDGDIDTHHRVYKRMTVRYPDGTCVEYKPAIPDSLLD